jgi:hypothetical protein
MAEKKINRALGHYSQLFILFATYKWAHKARAFVTTNPFQCSRMQAYSLLGQFVSRKKMRCCEYGTRCIGLLLILLIISGTLNLPNLLVKLVGCLYCLCSW